MPTKERFSFAGSQVVDLWGSSVLIRKYKLKGSLLPLKPYPSGVFSCKKEGEEKFNGTFVFCNASEACIFFNRSACGFVDNGSCQDNDLGDPCVCYINIDSCVTQGAISQCDNRCGRSRGDCSVSTYNALDLRSD